MGMFGGITKVFRSTKYPPVDSTLRYDKDKGYASTKYQSPYVRDFTYSGCDIIPVVYGLDRNGVPSLHVIGDIATLTYSVHQEKGAVRTLGRSAPISFTRGPETIAGTMIFNILNEQALMKLSDRNRGPGSKTQHMHRLPMFDIILYFADEAGHRATLGIFGIQIVDEGQSHSVEDTYVENTASYVALGVEPLERIDEKSERSLIKPLENPTLSQIPFNYEYVTPEAPPAT